MGEPVLLTENGEVNEEMLQKERMSISELEMQHRIKGVLQKRMWSYVI